MHMQKKDMTLVRVFDAPVEAVWKAWTESSAVMKWWGPKDFTCPVADMDVREGGTSLVCMRAPADLGGMDIYSTWTYTKVVPNERLEYILRFTDKDGTPLDPITIGLPAGIPKEVPHIIAFKAKDGKTEVTITEKGYTTDMVVESSRQGMEQCCDKMGAALEG
jgi:uncharacterized protein YndB with AHSA1/START domain